MRFDPNELRLFDSPEPTHPQRNWSGVVRVPHAIRSEERLMEAAIELLCAVPAADKGKPTPLLGYLWEVGVGAAWTACAVGLTWRWARRRWRPTKA